MSFSSSSNTLPSHGKTPSGSTNGRAVHPEISVSVCLDCGTPVPARMLDLARTDLTILTDRPLRFGTPLQLVLFSDLVSAVTQNRGIVHLCRPHRSGWQIGAFLTSPLPDRLTESVWNDLKNSLRHECNWKAWILWDESGELETVRILNYSINGLRLSSATPVSAGSTFALFGSAGRHDRAVLKGRVQWCRGVDDGCQIGCVVHAQRGRDLPKMFGNLAAVHVDGATSPDGMSFESDETLRCEQARTERFLASSPQHA